MAIDDNASYELTGYQVKDLASKIRAKADSSALASVATSGLYSDLTGAPTIPTVYNGTLTIQQNGTQLGTFSANQSSDTTINITGGGGATYTAGNGINIDANNEISVDTTVVQEKLTAGTGISISAQNVISATSSGATVFYTNRDWLLSTSTSVLIYKDDALTTPATSLDIYNASTEGSVIIAFNYDKTTPNTDALIYTISESYYDAEDDEYIFSGMVSYNPVKTFYISEYGAPGSYDIVIKELQDKITAGSNVQINNNVISATDTTYSNFTGATSSVAGTNGLVPAPAAGDEGKALHGDGTWKDTTAKLVEMSYGEANSWAKFIAAYNAGSIVYCRASSNANPGTGSQTRKAFMAYVNNATSPTSVEFQYVRSQSSKTASQQCDQVFVYTLTNSNGGTWSVASRDMAPKIVAGTGMSSTFTTGANATITLNAEPDYSTSEVDTKVKWIDGKTIYRKTVNVGAMPNATTTSTNIGASNVSHYIKIEGVAWTSDGNTTIMLPFTQTASTSYQISVYISNGDIMITAGDDKSAYTQGYATVYYTKSS